MFGDVTQCSILADFFNSTYAVEGMDVRYMRGTMETRKKEIMQE